MLYQDKTLGQPTIARRVTSALRLMFSTKRQADLDLLSMNPHLRRDLGLQDFRGLAPSEIYRK